MFPRRRFSVRWSLAIFLSFIKSCDYVFFALVTRSVCFIGKRQNCVVCGINLVSKFKRRCGEEETKSATADDLKDCTRSKLNFRSDENKFYRRSVCLPNVTWKITALKTSRLNQFSRPIYFPDLVPFDFFWSL